MSEETDHKLREIQREYLEFLDDDVSHLPLLISLIDAKR